jgi:hypothetical protein
VLVGLEVTARTRPRPSAAELREVIWGADSPRYGVRGHCNGDRFVADRVVRLTAGRGPR